MTRTRATLPLDPSAVTAKPLEDPVVTRHPRTAARLVAAGAAAAALLAGCGSSPVRAGAAAVVGGSRVSTQQLATLVDQGLGQPGAEQQAADRPKFQRDLLTRLIQADVVERAARDKGVTVTQSDVDATYAEFEKTAGSPDELRRQAAAAGLSLDQVRALSRTRALGAALTAGAAAGGQGQSDAVRALLAATARKMHVSVNPRFGAWDGEQLQVVPRTDTGNREVSSPAAPAGGPAAQPAG